MSDYQKIYELVTKPSEALEAMVAGLEKQSKRRNFIVDMETYGEKGLLKGKYVCYGCAATCATQEIAGKNFTPSNIEDHRANVLHLDKEDLIAFEYAIDRVRKGSVSDLFHYYDLAVPFEVRYPKFWLDNENWKEQIPLVKEYIQKLKEIDL